jgi:hypothetical protein
MFGVSVDLPIKFTSPYPMSSASKKIMLGLGFTTSGSEQPNKNNNEQNRYNFKLYIVKLILVINLII